MVYCVSFPFVHFGKYLNPDHNLEKCNTNSKLDFIQPNSSLISSNFIPVTLMELLLIYIGEWEETIGL